MIRVLSIVPYPFLPAKMGGQKGIALFNEYFGKETNLEIVSVTTNDECFARNYSLLKLFKPGPLRYINFFYFFRLKKIIQQKKITHILLEHPYYGWLALLLKYFCGVTLIAKSHNIESLRFKTVGKWWWGILWHYEKWVYRFADYSFFITEEDKKFAVDTYGVNALKCHVITYGTDQKEELPFNIRRAARETLCTRYGIGAKTRVLFFNGTLSYKPNIDALNLIKDRISPILTEKGFNHKVIICGKGLPAIYNNLDAYRNKNIIYAGFVDDISIYFNGADIMLNPVNDGGGIKTKLVEALGAGVSCVSTLNGAIGVPLHLTGGKMMVVDNQDWQGFADCVMKIDTELPVPAEFYKHFYWGAIAQKAAQILFKPGGVSGPA